MALNGSDASRRIAQSIASVGILKMGDAHGQGICRISRRGFAQLRRTVAHLATWDDNDYGQNDGGAAYPMRRESQQVFLDFFQAPADDVRAAGADVELRHWDATDVASHARRYRSRSSSSLTRPASRTQPSPPTSATVARIWSRS